MRTSQKLLGALILLLAATPMWASFTGTDVFLPSVGAKPGVSPAVWYTTVWVHNPKATAANITVYLLERQANPAPLSYTDTIQPGDTAKYENAVQLMFSKQTFGALRVTSNVKVLVGSRIYSQSGELKDSVGQFFAGTPASFAIGTGQSTELIGVYGTTPSAGSIFRYNFGFVETTGTGTCDVKVTVKDAMGTELGNKSYPLRQWEQIQKSFKDEFPSISTENTRLTVEVTSGTGKIIAFGSSVANGSLDPATFEMAFRDELLAENVSSGSITAVTAGAGLTGGGTAGAVALDVGAGAGIAVDANNVSIADGGVTTAKLANGAVTAAKVGTSGGSNGQVLTVTAGGAAWQAASGGTGDITGVTAGTGLAGGGTSGNVTVSIANGGVGSNQLAAGAVVSSKLGPPISIGASVAGAVFDAENTGTGPGVHAESASHDGIQGVSDGSGRSGVYGVNSKAGGFGVYGRNTAVSNWAYLGGTDAVHGETATGNAVYGKNTNTGANGYLGGTDFGVHGQSTASLGTAIFGTASGSVGIGVSGVSTGNNGSGLSGIASNGSNASGVWAKSTTGNAGYFWGNVNVTGTLSKGGGSFKIDHPLDPGDKYLYHSFVESPDMKDIYDGVVTLDGSGEAVVELPDWFEALNRDFRYQLTAVGAPGPNLYIAEEITGNRFRIAGGRSGARVSWQVTGIRHDAFADAHRIPVEEAKPEGERGYFLYPELFGQPEEKSVGWAQHPELMERLGAEEQKATQTKPR